MLQSRPMPTLSAPQGAIFLCVCNIWGPLEASSCSGPTVSSTAWHLPLLHEGKAPPYLAPGSPFPGFIPPHPNTALFERHSSWESVQGSENPISSLSLPCLLCQENIHSSELFMILSFHQAFPLVFLPHGKSSTNSHGLTPRQANNATALQTDEFCWFVFLFFVFGSRRAEGLLTGPL